MSDDDSMVAQMLAEIDALLGPITRAADNDFQRDQLFEALGGDLGDLSDAERDDLVDGIESIEEGFEEVRSLVENSPSSMDLVAILAETAEVFIAIRDIESVLAGTSLEGLADSLVEYLVMMYLSAEHPALLQVGFFLTIVRIPGPGIDDLPQGVSPDTLPLKLPEVAELEPQVVGDLLSDPIQTLEGYYLPDGEVTPDRVRFLSGYILSQFQVALGKLGFDCALGFVAEEVDDIDGYPDLTVVSRSLNVKKEADDGSVFGIDIALGVNDGRLAVIASPYGAANVEFTSGAWELVLGVTGEFEVIVVDDAGIQTVASSDQTTGQVGVHGEVTRTQPADGSDSRPVRIGTPNGTRFEVETLGLSTDLTGDPTSGEFNLDILLAADNSNITVAPGDADSFIQKILPEDGIGVDFDAGLGWNTNRGIYFEGGGAGLATDIPVNLDIAGVLKVETLRLAAKPDLSGEPVTVPVRVAADPQVSIGPMDGVVEGIGLEAELSFPQGSDGNLGPVHVDLGFKPPTGAGMSLDAGVVTGGGFLSFDHENERYAGVLQLKIGELTITAVGLLSTQLPGGREGYSLLLIISGEFPAFQLGFGFTLDGLGGLVGANRAMDVDYLMAGVSDGTVRSIMFPDDPVRNAPQIISDLRSGFPVAAGNHVIGPMAKLGWGTPSMLSASIGVLLDLPNPVRVVIIGRLHMGLPHEEVGIVVFNMDLLGAVDPEAQTANGAATLYDSRIVAYVISGDMAVKTGWGDAATFVLSVGGFNPRFEPPDAFPSLDRVALSIGPGNPEVRFAGYFAVTSNTAQVGASVQAHAEAAGFSFDGKMGFDTLFRFEPFELIVDFYAGFTLRKGSKTLMTVDVDGTLKGPGPWHLNGKAKFKIWPVKFTVSIDAEFGPSKSAGELSPADVYGQVIAAIEDSRNWSAQRPASGQSIATFRELEGGGDQVLAHPLGRIAVRQQVAPLGVRLEKFGNGKPAGYDRFSIDGIAVGGEDEDDEATRERFAPAEYFELSDDEKLQGPEFERYEAGSRVENTAFDYGGRDDEGLLASDPLDYETAVIDEQASLFPIAVGRVAMPLSTASAVAEVSAVARGPLRTTGEARFAVTDEKTGATGVDAGLSVSDANYVVVDAGDLTRVDLEAVPADGTTKREAREALAAHVAETGGDRAAFSVVGAHEAASQGASG